MPTVIPVKFKYAARDLWFDPADTGALEGDHVICVTERGEEIGLATMDPIEMDDERLRATIGDATLKRVLRVADDSDLDHAELLAERGEEALPTFRRLVKASELDMKPVGVEYLFDGNKVVCYFSAEERVDFRQLVRDLSRELHERIDMRQIGVREEAAVIGGFAHCGQELCCARFGRQFEPVSIRMAKEQDLPLNSTKISGACGRLMCCLRYEFEAYRDFKSRAPKRNAVIDTPLGKGKIVEYDTPKEQICLRLENGKQVRVSLSDMVASEAAVRKSEELNCPCRPDTVTRAALDKLESPEIKMALAELDRKNGVIPEETIDESDLFVETKPRRRRRKGGSGAADEATAQPGQQAQRQGGAQRSAGAAQAEDQAAPARSRRRRRKAASGEGAEERKAQAPKAEQADAASQASGTRRRRRHHSAGEGTEQSAQQQAQGRQDRPKGMQPKRKRRPGDRGGAAAQQAGQEQRQGQKQGQKQAQKQGQSKPKHRAPAPAQDGAASTRQEGEAKPKRRRRHRGGRGRGKGGSPDSAGGAPSGTE